MNIRELVFERKHRDSEYRRLLSSLDKNILEVIWKDPKLILVEKVQINPSVREGYPFDWIESMIDKEYVRRKQINPLLIRGEGGRARMRKICVEEHWHNLEIEEMRKLWRERTKVPLSNDPKATPQVLPRTGDFEKFRLPLMDEYGMSMQVLASNSPGIQAGENAAKAVSAAKRFNDAQAEVIGKYAGRFAGWASLPTQDPKPQGRGG